MTLVTLLPYFEHIINFPQKFKTVVLQDKYIECNLRRVNRFRKKGFVAFFVFFFNPNFKLTIRKSNQPILREGVTDDQIDRAGFIGSQTQLVVQKDNRTMLGTPFYCICL